MPTGNGCVADDGGVRIERIERRAIVSLTVSRASIDEARRRLMLAAPLRTAGSDPASVWLAPNRWLLLSDERTADSLIAHCESALDELVHCAVDQSAAHAIFRLVGAGVRDLLARGCGVDIRPTRFRVDACCRTRLAQIAAVLVACEGKGFECYVERSLADYLEAWLQDSCHSGDLHAGCASG